MFRNPLEERGGGGFATRAIRLFKKKVLSAHYVPTTCALSKRAQKRAEMLHHPCILRDPQTKGDKIRIGCPNPAF